MKIVVDLQACQSGSRLGGIGRYSLALAKGMARCRGNHQLVVVLSSLFRRAEYQLRMEFADLLEPHEIVSFNCPGPVEAKDSRNSGSIAAAEKIRESYLRDLQPDIIHCASFVEGWGDNVVTSVGPQDLAERTAVTWYDLIPYVQPEMYLSDPQLAEHYYGKVKHAQDAALWLAISQFTCDEAQEVLGRSSERVVNISAAVDESFRPREYSPGDAERILGKFGIDRKFLLYTGSFDTRKNQAGLIRAFAALPPQVRNEYQLAICGNGWPGVYADLRKQAAQVGVGEDQLIFTGRVEDDELMALYNLAHLFVFPSLREGFGLPALEAMKCGTPAIGSNCTSIPEVIGREDALFDPNSTPSITQKMLEVLTNAQFRSQLIEHGKEHAERFSWDASAKTAITAFEELHARCQVSGTGNRHTIAANSNSGNNYNTLIADLGSVAKQHRMGDTELLGLARDIDNNERTRDRQANIGRLGIAGSKKQPRVGWLTSWGVRCGIASYTRYLLEAKPELASAVLAEFTMPTETLAADGTNDLGIETRIGWRADDKDDLKHLAAEVDALDLDAIVIQFNYGFFDFPRLNQFVTEQVGRGRKVFMTLHSTTDPNSKVFSKKLSQLKPALHACDRILVHCDKDADRLQELGVVFNVTVFPHAVPVFDDQQQSGDVSHETFTVGTYGFALPHKGLPQIVEAVGQLQNTLPNIRLQMVNAEYSQAASAETLAQVQAIITKHNLQSKVTLTKEYLTDSQSCQLLRQCDLVVYPYQNTGESSSAAVRMGLASKRPVAVTPLPIFADVQDAVFQLPGTSTTDIAAGIQKLATSLRGGGTEACKMVGERADRWRSRHDVHKVAALMQELIHTHAHRSENAA